MSDARPAVFAASSVNNLGREIDHSSQDEAGTIQDMSPIKVDPEIMSGTPCFAGTRVPIQNLFDYIEGGDSLDVFLSGFPSVTHAQALAVLDLAKKSLLDTVKAA